LTLESLANKFLPYVPEKFIPVGMRLLCIYYNVTDKKIIRKNGLRAIPPASLRFRTLAQPSIESFLKGGKEISNDLESSLLKIGRKITSFENILEFGCGSGRIVLMLEDKLRKCNFFGTDIDDEAISWCKKNFDFGSFDVNKPLPPLKYQSEMFDLVWAHSVFTHLDEGLQFKWLNELKRITKPNGIVVISVHGPYAWSVRRRPKGGEKELEKELEKNGFVFLHRESFKRVFSFQFQSAYHTKEYIEREFSKYFEVTEYIPRGMGGRLDMIILQKN